MLRFTLAETAREVNGPMWQTAQKNGIVEDGERFRVMAGIEKSGWA